MVMLVSLEQASARVRRDTDDDDADLTLMIEGASEMVLNYLKSSVDFLNSSGEVDLDSSGTPVGVPKAVMNATLILVAIMYKNREAESEASQQQWAMGYLPPAVTAILYPLRDPALS